MSRLIVSIQNCTQNKATAEVELKLSDPSLLNCQSWTPTPPLDVEMKTGKPKGHNRVIHPHCENCYSTTSLLRLIAPCRAFPFSGKTNGAAAKMDSRRYCGSCFSADRFMSASNRPLRSGVVTSASFKLDQYWSSSVICPHDSVSSIYLIRLSPLTYFSVSKLDKKGYSRRGRLIKILVENGWAKPFPSATTILWKLTMIFWFSRTSYLRSYIMQRIVPCQFSAKITLLL